MDGQALVWNGADNKFYGVLNGGGAWATGVLVSFDPATDALVLLKTLSGRTYPAKRGLGSDMLAVQQGRRFLSAARSSPRTARGCSSCRAVGGVSAEGLLVHVNIDPTSASYLADTMVYDFFDYEVGQGNYCKSIRVAYLNGQTEMAWGKDGSGNDVVFMARLGEDYVVSPEQCAQPARKLLIPTPPALARTTTASTGGCSRSRRATRPTSRSPGPTRSATTTRSVPATVLSIRCSTWAARSTGTPTRSAAPVRGAVDHRGMSKTAGLDFYHGSATLDL